MRVALHMPHLLLLTRVVMVAFLVGLTTVACNRTSNSPVSPTPEGSIGADAATDGSTLKATTPGLISPTGGTQVVDPVVLTASRSTGKFGSIAPSYQFQVRSGSTVVYDSGVVAGVASGNNVAQTVPSSALNPDTDYTWRVRAVQQGQNGSWSSDGAFKSPVGAYIRGNEIRDPIRSLGRTVGTPIGAHQFTAQGIKLLTHESRVTYELPITLQQGEFSLMVTGIDEGSPGDKTKVMSMQEGFGDITTNDYRFTIEKRGSSYVTPGAVTFRIINGDAGEEDDINDGDRIAVAFSDERAYFWKASWRPGFAEVEVREDSPTGRVIYHSSVNTNSRPYRPTPHVVHLGTSVGRAGPIDASIPGATYWNVYVGPGPRPAFPQ